MRDIWTVSKHKKKTFYYFYCKKLSAEDETADSQISAVKIFGLWANLDGGGGHWTLEATNNLWTILIVTFPIIVNLAHRSLLSQKSLGRTTCLSHDLKLYQNYHYYRIDDDREDDDDNDDDDDDGQGKGYCPQALLATNQLSFAKVAFLLEPPNNLDRTWAHHLDHCHHDMF